MLIVKRHWENPVLKPDKENSWEEVGAFNASLAKNKDYYHTVYRAMSSANLSTIGYAKTKDAVHFTDKRQLIKPEYDWEKYGCEDPRVTKLGDKYFIFYTALSAFPFSAEGIKLGVATTHDFKNIEKHPVTTFNSKAMAVFPEKINGKIYAILTVDTDRPPAKISIASFDNEKQIWSPDYWEKWYANLEPHTLHLLRNANDHIEVGAPPIKTKFGWLIIYSYIKNYLSSPRTFGIEALLLDLKNPLKIVGRTKDAFLTPDDDYELYGNVPNIVFPSGAVVVGDKLYIYYGAADTTVALATVKLDDLLAEILSSPEDREGRKIKLERFKGNPIIKPIPEHTWESKYTLNPAAIYEDKKVHIVYRAMGADDTSVFGYAVSHDGLRIDERLAEPIYTPRESFEKKAKPGFSGCEDPRITKIDDKYYMCYTAYDAKNPWRVALTSISVDDFLNKRWNWKKPVLISPPGVDDKNACIFPEKIRGKYVILHRIDPCIWIDFVDDLEFGKDEWVKGDILLGPREGKWDSEKVGIGGPPIKTKEGWFLFYHGLSKEDKKYRLGAVLLNLKYPDQIIARIDYPILEPEEDYETKGLRPNTVFSCGNVVIKGKVYVYYGAADHVVGVATMDFPPF